MNRQYAFSVLLLMVLSGCFGKPFQPNPPIFQSWSKPESQPDDIKAALLSCGYENPYTGFSTHLITVEKIAAGSQCMRKLGFTYLHGPPICAQPGASEILACR